MIARLTGTVVTLGKDSMVVQVGGLGLAVFVPQTLLDGRVQVGQKVTLFTHLHVRENELALYGCGSEEELAVFRLLLGVSGIGPKVALAILSSLPPDRLQAAIAQEDVVTLARVPGIGPKTAKKLVFDLKDKVEVEVVPGEPQPILSEADADLIAALTTLGYSVAETQEAIRSLPREPLPLEERVRLALAYFAS
ncbi:MAG: Holliday junction branch migration protein RuvA [Anaerolineae bacterium]